MEIMELVFNIAKIVFYAAVIVFIVKHWDG